MKRAFVFGKGRSGRAAERLLARKGYDVISLEGDDALPEGEAEFAVVSPGIALSHPWIAACRRRAIPLKSELALGVEELLRRGARLLAVTGSKGKSSVVKLVADALGGVPCGNYGTSVCEVALREELARFAVVEVSSFQMETTQLPRDAFEAAAILNLQEDHLDRHGDIATYHALKRKLLSFATHAIDGSLDPAPPAGAAGLLAGSYFDNAVLRRNGEIAIALLRAAGLDDAAIRRAFASFEPLPHRMQPVLEEGGVLYIDDSKATSIAALAAGVAMAPGRVRLVAGGLAKGDDLKIAIAPLRGKARKVYTIGRSAGSFASAWSGAVECMVCGTLERAVEEARREAEPGDTVLLSPGAASYDQFKSFEERGDAFARLVKKGKDKR